MKYRLGFVTNSSSSSFIFGRPNENTTTIDGHLQVHSRFSNEIHSNTRPY